MSRLNLRAVIPLVIPLALGLVALLIAIFALAQMIVAERADARASLDARERIVLDHATTEFSSQLLERLDRAEAAVDKAVADPLLPCPRCYYREGKRQVLPRLGPATDDPDNEFSAGRNSVRRAHAALQRQDATDGGKHIAKDTASAGDLDETWLERASLHHACADDRPGAAEAVLEHRGQYVLPIEQEIASTLALVEHCKPAAALLPAVLRDGMAPPRGRRIEGLQPMVLRHLYRLDSADAAFIVQRVIEVSKSVGVATSDFEKRLTELTATPLDLPPGRNLHGDPSGDPNADPSGDPSASDSDDSTEPLIARSSQGYWFVRASAAGVRGVSVDLGAVLKRIAEDMRSRSLLESEDRIELRLRDGALVALSRITLIVVSPNLSEARQAISERHAIKLALLALCGGMGLAICVLALVLQRRRRRLLELKSHFIASVSHELRTPLASMRVLVETLARRTRGMAEVRDYPTRVLSDIDGMSFLVENILSFNRLAKGQWEQRTVGVKLAEVVASACEEAEEWHSRPIRVECDLADVVLEAEPELLRLLFRNLALNAVTYNRSDPVEISVHLGSGPGQSLDVLFRDNGVGITAGERERVFDEFYRGSESAMARGSGLGLALCRRIMAMHDGTITVTDSSKEGTTFRLRFP